MIFPSIIVCGSASSIHIRFITRHHDDGSVNDCRSKEEEKKQIFGGTDGMTCPQGHVVVWMDMCSGVAPLESNL